jgi:7-carboxy-7-deazaguanine synthase
MYSLLDPPTKRKFPVINADVNATKNSYEMLQPDQLLIHSMFHTIQGEGPYAGQPALFIRLAGCNIGLKQDCPWCDTKFHLADGRVTRAHDAIMHELQAHKCDLIVFTGGEPLLQWQQIKHIIAQVDPHFGMLSRPTWQFETNGLLLREEMIDTARKHGHMRFVCSPKVPHTRSTYSAIPHLWLNSADVLDLKYIVTADSSSSYHDVPEDALVAENTIYISGMAVYKRSTLPGEVATIWDDTLIDQKATALNYRHAARLAMDYNRRMTCQTHLFGGVE